LVSHNGYVTIDRYIEYEIKKKRKIVREREGEQRKSEKII